MGRLLKFLFYLLVLAAVALVVFAYLGPLLGVDFSPRQVEIRTPVTLDAQ